MASSYALTCNEHGVDLKLTDELNRRLYEILGPGHHVQSCLQFIQGKKGMEALHALHKTGDLFGEELPRFV